MSHTEGMFFKDLREQPLSNPNYKYRCCNEVHTHLTNDLLVSWWRMKDKWKCDSPIKIPDATKKAKVDRRKVNKLKFKLDL